MLKKGQISQYQQTIEGEKRECKGCAMAQERAMRSKLRPDKNPFLEEHLIAQDHYAERQRASALAASMAQARAKAKREEQEQLREEAARRAADAEEIDNACICRRSSIIE